MHHCFRMFVGMCAGMYVFALSCVVVCRRVSSCPCSPHVLLLQLPRLLARNREALAKMDWPTHVQNFTFLRSSLPIAFQTFTERAPQKTVPAVDTQKLRLQKLRWQKLSWRWSNEFSVFHSFCTRSASDLHPINISCLLLKFPLVVCRPGSFLCGSYRLFILFLSVLLPSLAPHALTQKAS